MEARPLILCGDFNGSNEEAFYQVVTSEHHLIDAYASYFASVPPDMRWTSWKCRGEEGTPAFREMKRRIDYIFTTPHFLVVKIYAPPSMVDLRSFPSSQYGSDHIAIAADLLF